MSAADRPIVVVVNGLERRYVSVDELLNHASFLRDMASTTWKSRIDGNVEPDAVLAILSEQVEIIAALAIAGLERIEQETAEAEAAMAEIDRLFGEM